MGLTARKTSEANLERLRSFLGRHAEALEPGLTVVDRRLKLGGTDVDVLATDRCLTPVLVVAGGVADTRLLVAGLEACLWCLAFPDTLRRLYPDAPMALHRPPRLIFVAEHVSEEFVRMVEALSVVRAECHELSCAWRPDGGHAEQTGPARTAALTPGEPAELPVEPVRQAVLGLREALAELLGDRRPCPAPTVRGEELAAAPVDTDAEDAPGPTAEEPAAPWPAERSAPGDTVAAAAEAWRLESFSAEGSSIGFGMPVSAQEASASPEPTELGRDGAPWEAVASHASSGQAVSPEPDGPPPAASESPPTVQRPAWAAPPAKGAAAGAAPEGTPGATGASGERARVFFRGWRRAEPAGSADRDPEAGSPPQEASDESTHPEGGARGHADEAASVNHPALEALRFPKGGVSRQWQEFLDQLTKNR